MRFLVVIPAFNEGASLGALLCEVDAARREHQWAADVVVVDDGSRDDTSEIALKGGARLVRLCRNLGIGAAVQTGLRLARREGFDAAIQVDGDGQHPPGEITRLLACAASDPTLDLVVGSRLLGLHGYQATGARRWGQRWLTLWLRTLTGLKILDPTSGFRFYGRRAIELFSASYPSDYPEPEVLAVAAASGLRVKEEAVVMRERQGGRSSIRGLDPLYYMIKVTFAMALCRFRQSARRGIGTSALRGGVLPEEERNAG